MQSKLRTKRMFARCLSKKKEEERQFEIISFSEKWMKIL
jgi:hypothetical protein